MLKQNDRNYCRRGIGYGRQFDEVEEVAKYLKVEESTVYTWPEQGKIPVIKIGRF